MHDGTLPRFLKRAVVAQTVIILSAVWGYSAWRIIADREQTLQTGRQQLRTVSAGLHAHVEAILNDSVGSAVAASKEVAALGGMDRVANEQLTAILGRHLSGGTYVRAVFLATPQRFAQASRVRPSIVSEVVPQWLQPALQDQVGDTYVGPALDVSGTTARVVPIAVRVSGAGQEPQMWAGTLLGLSSLDALYRRLRFDDGVIGIFVPTGDVLVRVPQIRSEITPDVSSRRMQLTRRQVDMSEEALFETVGPVSGALTVFYTRRIAGYPLVVSAGRARDSILAPWRTRTAGSVAVLAGFSIVLIALALLLRHLLNRLERRESHYRTLFNNTTVSVFLMCDEVILEANATAYRMFRVPAGTTFEGLHPWDISPPQQPDGSESATASRNHLRRAQTQGQLKFRWTHRRMDTQEPFPAEVSLSSMQIGTQSLILSIVNDLTELEAARLQLQSLNAELETRVLQRTAELREANARLALTNRELEAFSASASHDMRSPLGSIAGQAGLLREELLPMMTQTMRHRLDRIADSVKRCADIIDGLLSLAKLTRQELISEPVDFTALARGIAEDLRQQYPQHDVAFTVTEGITLNADPRLLKSLLSNLLDNAWKYTSRSAQPRVEIRCDTHQGEQQFSVCDNGVGFDMNYASKLFEPFQRMHSPQEFPGTGIGLATVARIVQRYGGRIWAESSIGQGTAIHFTLPAAAIEQGQNIRTQASSSAG